MFQNNLLMGAASISTGGLTVDDSVRYNDDDSPRLYKTPAIAGNQVMGSLSLWYKRCNLGSIMQLFNSGAGNDITFNASDQLTFIDSSGVSYITTQVFRDTTAWGHLLFAWNTSNATSGNRLRIYHNGVEITAFGTETNPSAGDTFGISKGDTLKTVGANESNTEEFDGYLSQVYLVDGQQLTPASFGETDDNGVWRPIAYSAGGSTASALSIAFTDSAVDSTTQTTFTFSSVDIGTAASDRKVVVAVGGQVSGSTQTSVTVGGESCTLAAVHSSSQVGRVAFWEIDLATGTSEDIVVVFGQSNNCAGIGVWALTGDMVVYDTIKDSRSGNPTGEITCPAGSVIMGYELVNKSPDMTFTWAGITERFDEVVESNQAQHTGASGDFSEAQDDLTITVTPSGGAPTAAAQAMVVICYAPTATTYGTTGFKLDFADSSDFGNDVSGNNNDYTSSGLAANDQFTDTPTKNACVMSVINENALAGQKAILSNGGLVITGPAAGTYGMFMTNMGIPTSGKYWYKHTLTYKGGGATWGLCSFQNSGWTNAGGYSSTFQAIPSPTLIVFNYYRSIIHIYNGASPVTDRGETTQYNEGDVFEFLIDRDAGEVALLINDSLSITITGLPATQIMFPYFSCYNATIHTADFGANGSTPSDTDYQNINTTTMPTPTILDGTANFQTTLYTGDGSTRNIDQTENSTFQPDMVWIKNRSQADDHMLIDAPRGVTKELNPNDTRVQSTDANGLTSFDSDGFGLGTGAGGYNDDTESFVAWQWLAGGGAGSSNTAGSINTIKTTVNTAAGISIGTYTGTGVAATVGHGLGVVPQMVIVKDTSAVQSWLVYHEGVATDPGTDFLKLNESVAVEDHHDVWDDTAPTSTVFSIGIDSTTNRNTSVFAAYCFADVEGFSKIGNYFGNGLSVLSGSGVGTGPVVYTGFKPAFVMIKNITSTGNWVMYDNQRSPYNEIDDQLLANTTAAETTGSEEIDFLSNGFKIQPADSDVNTINANYVYAAFAEYPFGGEDVTPATTF